MPSEIWWFLCDQNVELIAISTASRKCANLRTIEIPNAVVREATVALQLLNGLRGVPGCPDRASFIQTRVHRTDSSTVVLLKSLSEAGSVHHPIHYADTLDCWPSGLPDPAPFCNGRRNIAPNAAREFCRIQGH